MKQMLKFEYWVTLKNGCKPASCLETDEINEVCFVIESINRATADRIVKAMFLNDNIIEYSGICIEH